MYRDKLKQIVKSPAVRQIWCWSKTIRLPLLLICLLTLLSSGGSLVITLATRGLIDGACEHSLTRLTVYGLALTVAVLVIRACGFFSGRIRARINARFARDLRELVLHGLLQKQYEGLSRYHSGELVNRMFSDINVVRDGVLGIVPSLVSMAVSFFGAAAILLSMDWRFVILLVLGGFFGLFLMVLFRDPMKKRHKAMQESQGRLQSFLQETMENMRMIKASGSEERMEGQANTKQREFVGVQLKNAYFSLWMNTGIGMAFQISWLFCMLWGGYGIYKNTLTYGSLAAIIQLVNHIQWPIANAADIAAKAYGTVSSAERLTELLDLPEEAPCQCADRDRLYGSLREIRLNHVTFSYGGEDVLSDLNAVIRPGEFTALTGISGGGKSTLFQLLLGIYSPTGGSIDFVFDHGVEPASRRTRAMFGYVPQGNYLFSGTLRENLTMFTDAASDEEIMDAARIACIDEFIDELETGLDTVIGERGMGLSEGQAQRIAVARMLLSRAPVLLLDESTSALDEETEARLLDNISRLRSKTCIIVTHRQAALRICGNRLHMENGRLTEAAVP